MPPESFYYFRGTRNCDVLFRSASKWNTEGTDEQAHGGLVTSMSSRSHGNRADLENDPGRVIRKSRWAPRDKHDSTQVPLTREESPASFSRDLVSSLTSSARRIAAGGGGFSS